MRHLLTILDLDKPRIEALIARARALKERAARGIPHAPLNGRTLGLIFEKPSTRTRVSFEAAMRQLGGGSVFISSADSQIGRGEPVKDTSRVMSRYVDAVVIRTFGHSIVEEFAKYSAVPVINGLTDSHHPCQVLADVLTVVERKGSLEGLKAAWIGDGNNMANSWIEAATTLGFELSLACPEGYAPDKEILARAQKSGGRITVLTDPKSAAKDADVINTDVWASMGQEKSADERKKAFSNYQVNAALLKAAKKNAIVLHCLPAHRGEEITEEVLEGANSAVWDQAENRLHIQKAVLEWLIAGNGE